MNDMQAEVEDLANVETVAVADLLGKVRALAEKKMRFVTLTCQDQGDQIEVFYHFDKELELYNLRVLVDKGEEVPSISGIYLCAFLVENEAKEMFGLNVTDLALDYKGRLLLAEGGPKLPMLKSKAEKSANES